MKKISIILSMAVLLISTTSMKAADSSKILQPIPKQELEFNLNAFGNYLTIGDAQIVEGVYATPDRRYVIAVVKNQESTHDYIGVVINADNPYWVKGEVKFNFVKQDDGSLRGYYYNSEGEPFPVYFAADQNGIQSNMLQKLSLQEVQMNKLANL